MKTAKENLAEKSLSQKHHPVRQKLLSVLLCVCLLLVSLPLEFYGSKVQAEELQKKVLSFSELPKEVKYQAVEPGTPLEDLNLPKTLEAVCIPAGQESNVNPETLTQLVESPDVKGTAPEDGNSAEETQEVSEDTDGVKLPEEPQELSDKNDNEAEPPAENHTEEPGEPLGNTPEEQPESPTPDSEPGTEAIPEANPEEEQKANTGFEETAVIEHVTWAATPAYDNETEGVYIFAAVLPEGYVMAEGVGLPEVQVTVKAAEGSGETGTGRETALEGKRERSEAEEEITEEYADGTEDREYGALAASDTRVISADETWNGSVTLSDVELVINEGVTLTIEDTVTIDGTVTIRGGGTIARGIENTYIMVGENDVLTMQNITVDGKKLYASDSMITVIKGCLTVESDCRIQDCYASRSNDTHDTHDTYDMYGGAVHIAGGTAEITDCIITDCSVTSDGGIAYGGAIYSANSNLTMKKCSIQKCYARSNKSSHGTGPADGGAVYISNGTTEFADCIITDCSTSSYQSTIGGAIYSVNSSLTMKKCSIQKCRSGWGGAAYISNGTTEITDCTITDCSASSYGGAVVISSDRSVEFTGCTIEKCSVTNSNGVATGGAVYIHNGTAEFTDCIVKGCSAKNSGGAIHAFHGTLKINGGTYRDNKAIFGNGGFLSIDYSTVYIYGGDFIGNTAAEGGGAIFKYATREKTYLYLYGGTFQRNSSSGKKPEEWGSGGICVDSYCGGLPVKQAEIYFEMAGGVKFYGDGTNSGMDGIYLDSRNENPRKITVSSTLNYPTTVYLEAVEHYVIAEGTNDYRLTREDLRKFSVVDVNGGEWYKKLDTDNNQIYLTKADPGYGFRIFYEGVDGKVTDDTEYSPGASATIKPGKGLADPIPNEEKFLGWCENEDGTGDLYKGGETVVMEKDLYLYPVYEKKTLSADFYSGGPDPSKPHHEEREVGEDVESETIAAPSLGNFPGWTPLGWTEENEGDTAYESTIAEGGDCTLAEDTKKYYGVYQKEVTLTYDSSDSEITVTVPQQKGTCYANVHETITYKGADITLAEGPEIPGYTFKGWSEQADGTGGLHGAGTVFSIHEDTTLYAVYEEKPKKTFTADFYSGSMCQPESVTKTGEETAASAEVTAPELKAMEGWAPLGWEKENPSGYKGAVKPNAAVTLEKTKTNFYGVYQKRVSLTYGSSDRAVTAAVTMPGEEKGICYANVHEAITYQNADFTLAEGPEVPGYGFKGWSEQESGGGTLHGAGTVFSIHGDAALYAVYEEKGKKTFTADFYSGDPLQVKQEKDVAEETATEGAVTAPALQAMAGWAPLGWEKEDTSGYAGAVKPNATVTLEQEKTNYYGIYEKEITLTYHANGGDSTPAPDTKKRYANVHDTVGYKDPEFGLAPAISRGGDTFVEWNTAPDGTGDRYAAGGQAAFQEDTVLYAVFVEKGKKTLAADFYSGERCGKESRIVAIDETGAEGKVEAPGLQEFPGWTPLGWSRSSTEYRGSIGEKETCTLTEPVTEYYGVYRKSVTLTYDANGGDTAPEPERRFRYANVHQDITYKDPEFLLAAAPARAGYAFKGWNTGQGQDGTGAMYEAGSAQELSQDMVLYASWEEDEEIVNYQVEHYCQNLAGDGYTRMDADTETLAGRAGTEVTARPKKYAGFTVDLSNPSGKASGIVERDGSLALKLYYDRDVYEVDFNLNGGYGTTPETQKVRYGNLLRTVDAPSKRGYNFKGWYMEEDGLEAGFWDFGSPVENNTGTLHTTLYAKWADELAPVMGEASFGRGHKNFLDWALGKESLAITVPVTEEGSGLAKAEYLLLAEDGTEKDGTARIKEAHPLAGGTLAYGGDIPLIRAVQETAEQGGYEAEILIEEEFRGKVCLTCTDYAGNVSAQKTLTAKGGGAIVEGNAPKIRFTHTEDAMEGKPVEVEVQVKDGGDRKVTGGLSSIRYQVDNGKVKSLPEEEFSQGFVESYGFTVKIAGKGEHTLRVEAGDHAGNESAAKVTVKIHGKEDAPAKAPDNPDNPDSPKGPGQAGEPGRPAGGEPKTGDSGHVKIYATVAMIAGFGYLLLYFEGENGLTEQEKEEIVYRLLGWAKRGGLLRRLLGVAVIFLFLAYYHSIGKSVDVEWKEVYVKRERA